MARLFWMLAVVVVAGIGWSQVQEWSASRVVKTPGEEMEQLLSRGGGSSIMLAQLCNADPKAGEKLRDRLLTVSGPIVDMRLVSVEQDRAELVLEGEGSRSVRVVLDLKKYNTLAVRDANRARYAIVGHELLQFSKPGALGKVIFRRGQLVSKRVRYAGMGLTDVAFHAE